MARTKESVLYLGMCWALWTSTVTGGNLFGPVSLDAQGGVTAGRLSPGGEEEISNSARARGPGRFWPHLPHQSLWDSCITCEAPLR